MVRHIAAIEELSKNLELSLTDAAAKLSGQIETVRVFASRLEPIDERSARTEKYLLDAIETMSKQIEAVRLFASRLETD